MLYHSPLKHFVKGLLGRKNNAWYVDAQIAKYKGLSYTEFINYTKGSIQNLSKNTKEHPLFEKGYALREKSIGTFKNVIRANFKVAVQVPPSNFSPGGFSFYNGLVQTLQWMGGEVIQFWPVLPNDESTENLDLMIVGNFHAYSIALEQQVTNQQTVKARQILATVDLMSTDIQMPENIILKAISKGVTGFISHYFDPFVSESKFSEVAAKFDVPVYSLPIGLNALYHYPEQFICPVYNCLFLASANYDKAKRTFEYLQMVSEDKYSCIMGPGWPWSNSFAMQPGAEKKIMSFFKVSLNLHLQSQIDYETEINERVYINAATGTPQITDAPALIHKLFPSSSFIAQTPMQYSALVKALLHEPFKFQQEQSLWMDTVFTKHTLFHRISNLLNSLKT